MKTSTFSIVAAGISLSCFAIPSWAAGVSDKVADTARKCVTTKICTKTSTGKAFSAAVYASDRLGWELGRRESLKKYGIDPGPYPGLKRR